MKKQFYDRIFQERLAADYDVDAEISEEEAKEALEFAGLFYTYTSNYFKSNNETI